MEVGESECLHVGVRALCMELQRLCARVTAQLVVPGVLKVSHREAARLAGGVMRFPCCRWEIILPCFLFFFCVWLYRRATEAARGASGAEEEVGERVSAPER